MMSINVGINGFGRIGRIVFRTSYEYNFNLVAINDPAFDLDYLMYLIKFDSTHGKFNGDVRISPDSNGLIVMGKFVHVFHEKNINAIPWHSAGVEYVVEATGVFNTRDKAAGHLGRGVRRVVVAAPSVDIPMFLLGVNDGDMRPTDKIVSCASSTLYCMAALLHVLDRRWGVAEGLVTSVQAATAALKPVDGLCVRGKSWREHRGVLQNVIPTSSGACRAVAAILPRLRGRLAGLALRAPVVDVSLLDLTVRLSSDTSLTTIIKAVEEAGRGEMRDVIRVSRERAVSSDFLGDQCSCILDAESSLELNSRSFKLIGWYENEYSFARRVLSTVELCAKQECSGAGGAMKNVLEICGDSSGIHGDMKIPVIVNEITMKTRPPHSPILIQNLNACSSNFVELQSLRSRMDLIKLWNSEETSKTSVCPESVKRSGKRWISHTCQTDVKTPRRRHMDKRVKPHEADVRKSLSLNEQSFKVSAALLRLNLPELPAVQAGNSAATSTHGGEIQLGASQAETHAPDTLDDGWSLCRSEELIANVRPCLVTDTSTTASRDDCRLECCVECSSECRVECKPECRVECHSESRVECRSECRVECRSECRVDGTLGQLIRRCYCSLCHVAPPRDLCDKLSCSSGDVGRTESQVIDMNDLALSMDDFFHLDKMCKILEKSDDVSDKVLATMNANAGESRGSASFKDMCERIKLDKMYKIVVQKSP